jgi:4-amino-4-deoxy-L-arabinose transferase-like glycosyltransferase
MTGTRQRRALWMVLLALWLGLWFAGSQYRSLLEPDEGRYAEVPREMVASGNWVTPRYDGVLFLDKPALQYWGTALAYEAFGASNWTARLWGLLTGLLGMLAVGWAGARAFGRVAGWSAAAVLGSSLLWVVGSHLNTLDMGVAALLGTSLCTFILAQLPDASVRAQRGWMLLTWLAMAAAFLSKGLIGIVFPGGALFFYMLWTGQWYLLRRMQWLLGLSLFLLLVLPWYIALQLRHDQFLHYFFIGQQFTRYLSDRFDRSHPFWFFLPVGVIGMFPWLALLPAALRLPPRQDGFDVRKLLWIWTLMIFVFFSISHSKLPLYLLPVFPAVALLVGDAIARLRARALGIGLLIAAALLLVAVPLALLRPVPGDLIALGAAFHGYMRHLAVAMVLACALLALAAWLAWRGRRLAGVGVAACAGLGLMQAALIGFQALAPAYSAAPLARAMHPWLKPDAPVYMVDTLPRGLPFYLRRQVTLVGAAPYDLLDGLRWQPRLLWQLPAFEQAWRTQPDALAVIAPQRFAALLLHGLPMRVIATSPKWVLVRKPPAATDASGAGAMDNRAPTSSRTIPCPHASRSAVPPSTATACSPAARLPAAAASSNTRAG